MPQSLKVPNSGYLVKIVNRRQLILEVKVAALKTQHLIRKTKHKRKIVLHIGSISQHLELQLNYPNLILNLLLYLNL